jgi:hypothetical protein
VTSAAWSPERGSCLKTRYAKMEVIFLLGGGGQRCVGGWGEKINCIPGSLHNRALQDNLQGTRQSFNYIITPLTC